MEHIERQFVVGANADRAFTVWTTKAKIWWPRSHTMGGESHREVVFEPGVGGRIFERTTTGEELDWGEVTAWEPPRRVGYLWHLFFDRAEATEVEVSFEPVPEGTRVTIAQTGFDRLGVQGPPRRTRTEQAWEQLSGLYAAAL
jgi:hypothetical protein